VNGERDRFKDLMIRCRCQIGTSFTNSQTEDQ